MRRMLCSTEKQCEYVAPNSEVSNGSTIKLEINPVGPFASEKNSICESCSCKLKTRPLCKPLLLNHMIEQEVETKNAIKLEKPDALDEHTSIEVNETQDVLNEPAAVVLPSHIEGCQTLAVGGKDLAEHTNCVGHRALTVGGKEPAEHTSCAGHGLAVGCKEPAEHTSCVGDRDHVISNLHVRSPCLPSCLRQTAAEFNSSDASLTAEISISQSISKVNCMKSSEKNICFCLINCDVASVGTCRNRPSYLDKPTPCLRHGGDKAPARQPVLQDPNDLRNLLNATRKRKLQHIQCPLDGHLERILKVNVVPGKCSNKRTYSRLLLVADECFQPLSDLWSWNSEVVPDLIIKADLKITDLEPIVNALINVCSKNNSKKMLIIVALRLNESFTFTPFKDCDVLNHKSLQCITLQKNKIPVNVFKTLKRKFESKVDLVFAHVIPAGWHLIQRSLIAIHAVLEGHKVFSAEFTGQTVKQANLFVRNCSFVNSYLDVNGLSSINGLPCWNLLTWESSVIKPQNCCLSNLPVQSNGKDLTPEALQTIALNVCELSLIYQKHSKSDIPPDVSNFHVTPNRQAETETKTFSKLVLIADAKLSLLAKKWPEHFSLQPEMQVSGVLKPTELLKELLATHDQTKGTFFILCPSIRNLLLVRQLEECTDHNALKYPSCRNGLGKNSTVENMIFQKIQKLKSSILENFKNSCVALSTVHCIQFKMIFNNLCTKHQKETGHVITHLNEQSFTDKQTLSLQIGINTLNELICKENRCSELPSFDVYDFIDVNNSSNVSKYMRDGMNLSEEAITILADRFIENLIKFNKNIFFNLNQSLDLSCEGNSTMESQDIIKAEEINYQALISEVTPYNEISLLPMMKMMPQCQRRELVGGQRGEPRPVEENKVIDPITSEDGWSANLLPHGNLTHSSEVWSGDSLSDGYETLNSVVQHDFQFENPNLSESHSNYSNCVNVKSRKAPIPIESVNSICHSEHEQTNLYRDPGDNRNSDTRENNEVTHRKRVKHSNQILNSQISPVCSSVGPLTSQESNEFETELPECDQAYYDDISSSAVVKKPPNKSPRAALRAPPNSRPKAVASSNGILKTFDNWHTFPNQTAAEQTLTNSSHCLDLVDGLNKLPLLDQIPSLGHEPGVQGCLNDTAANGSLQPSLGSSHVLEISELQPNYSQSLKNRSLPNYRQHLDYQRMSPHRDRQSPNLLRQTPESLRSSSNYQNSSNKHSLFPDHRHRSPDHRRRSSEYRRHSSEYRRHSPEYRRLSPEYRHRSPEYRRRSSEYRHHSPENRRRSPENRRRSPKNRRRSLVCRCPSPECRRPSEYRHPSPVCRRRSPENRRRSSECHSRSPEGRRRSPEGRRRSPEGRRCSLEYLRLTNDHQHSPSSVDSSGHDRPPRGRESNNLSRSLDGRSHSPMSSISSNDSLLDTGRSHTKESCSSKSNMIETYQDPRRGDHATVPTHRGKKVKNKNHHINNRLNERSNAKKTRKTQVIVGSPIGSLSSRCSVDSASIGSNCSWAKKENTSPCECQYPSKYTRCSNSTVNHLHSSDGRKTELNRKKSSPEIHVPKSILGVKRFSTDAHETVPKSKTCYKPICTASERSPYNEMFECRLLEMHSSLPLCVSLSMHLSRHNLETQYLDHEAKSAAKKTRSTKHGSCEGLDSLPWALRSTSSLTQGRCKRPKSPGATLSANKIIKDQLRLEPEGPSRLEAIALRSLWSFHGRECERYLKDPSTHPAYQDERRLFIESCITSTQSSVSDAQGFLTYWKNKLVDILEQTWQQRKQRCLEMLTNLQSYCNPCTLLKISPPNSKQQNYGADAINYDEKTIDSLNVLKLKRKWNTKKRTKLVEQLRTVSINCKKSLGLLNRIKLTHDELVRIILNESLLMSGDDHSSFIESDPCDVLITLRILSQMPETFESLSVSISMMLRTLLAQQQKVDLFLNCFSRYDKIFLKMAMCKLKELKSKSLEEIQNVIVNEAHDRLQALLFRLLEYSDPFFGLNIYTDDDAVEFSKIVNFVYCETKDNVEGTSMGSIIIILSMAVRRALTNESPILSSDENVILESNQVGI